MTNSSFRKLLFFQLPIAWLAGLRMVFCDNKKAQISVGLHWFSKNPFKSVFWAVQGMAAELSTGILLMNKIKSSGKKISFLVIEQNGTFQKKATGKIVFGCQQGKEIDAAIQQAITTNQAQTIKLYSVGLDKQGNQVAEFWFLWSIKLKNESK